MSSRSTTIRLATRGSDLALRQAATVKEALESRRVAVELVEVETTGDQLRDELIHRLGTTGAFVRSLDEKVVDGEVDAAVHSMKDVPTEGMDGLVVSGVPQRAAPGDVLLSAEGRSLADLPDGATVGTSSLRRGAQLLAARPDLDVEPLRGNVDTRVEKVLAPPLQAEHQARLDAEESSEETDEENDYEQTVEQWFDGLAAVERRALEREVEVAFDAIVLAAAGLERTGLVHHVDGDRLAPTEFVPAPGQGALAITARDDGAGDRIFDAIDHPPTRVETTVERTILDELGGGCVAPVGIYARLQGGVVTTVVRVLSQDGTEEVRATRELPVESHAEAAAAFAADLADQGAADLIEAARREEPDQAKREG